MLVITQKILTARYSYKSIKQFAHLWSIKTEDIAFINQLMIFFYPESKLISFLEFSTVSFDA